MLIVEPHNVTYQQQSFELRYVRKEVANLS